MISREEAKEKIAAGWFDVWLAFEGLAISQEAIRNALEGLVARLEDDTRVKTYEKEFLEPVKVENPLKGVKEAWSQVANVRIISKNFAELVQIILEYGPSSIEVIGPKKKELHMGEAQDVLNNVAGIMHRYAAAGMGGGIVVRGKE